MPDCLSSLIQVNEEISRLDPLIDASPATRACALLILILEQGLKDSPPTPKASLATVSHLSSKDLKAKILEHAMVSESAARGFTSKLSAIMPALITEIQKSLHP